MAVHHEDAALEAEVEVEAKVPSIGPHLAELRPEGWETVEDGKARNMASLENTQDAVPTQRFVKGTVKSTSASSTSSVS